MQIEILVFKHLSMVFHQEHHFQLTGINSCIQLPINGNILGVKRQIDMVA